MVTCTTTRAALQALVGWSHHQKRRGFGLEDLRHALFSSGAVRVTVTTAG